MGKRDDSSAFGERRLQPVGPVQRKRPRRRIHAPPSNSRTHPFQRHPAADVGLVTLFADDDLVAGGDRRRDGVRKNVGEGRRTRPENGAADSLAVDEPIHEPVGPLDGRGGAIARGIAGAQLDVVGQHVVADRVGDEERHLRAARVLEKHGAGGEAGIERPDGVDGGGGDRHAPAAYRGGTDADLRRSRPRRRGPRRVRSSRLRARSTRPSRDSRGGSGRRDRDEVRSPPHRA